MRRLTFAFASMFAGCSGPTPINPSFSISPGEANQLLRDAAARPRPLPRPLVIIGGYFDPLFATTSLSRGLRACTRDARIVTVPLNYANDFDVFRQMVVTAVDKAFPTDDPRYTVDVDVIGFSMGGVTARYAAIAPAPGRRLRVHRLFTISSPNSGLGSCVGVPIKLLKAIEQCRPDSPFLAAINQSSDPDSMFPVYSYVCLGDELVHTDFAAPPGQQAWWLAPRPDLFVHTSAYNDPRIQADILRRLQNEAPLSSDPPAPLPDFR